MVEPWTDAPHPPRRWQAEALIEIIKLLKQGQCPIVSAIMGAGKSVLIAELIWVALHKLKPGQKIVVTAPRQNLVAQLHKTIAERVGHENVGMFYTYAKDLDKRVIVTCNASAFHLSGIISDSRIAMVIGDEVHGSEAESFKSAYLQLNPACAVGFTATAYRSNEKEVLTLWDCVGYKYSAKDALEDGVIVPWKIAHWNGRDAKAKNVDLICMQMIQFHCHGPGIISALDIADAEKYAAYVRAHGFECEAIHSKISKPKRDGLLRKLKRGDLDMLVHVNLLCEGVDMPWLKWLCLRRPVGARVRFVQEVGRVLRCYPEKEYALILDPHDLFSLHALEYPEALGEVIEVDPDDEELASLIKDPEQRKKIKEMPPAKAVGHLESWVRNILTTMKACGICASSTFQPPAGLSTPRQRSQVLRLRWATRYLPGYVRGDFKMLLPEEKLLTLKAETVSDIISILIGLANKSKPYRKRPKDRGGPTYWHFPNIPLPVLSAPVAGLLFAANRGRAPN